MRIARNGKLPQKAWNEDKDTCIYYVGGNLITYPIIKKKYCPFVWTFIWLCVSLTIVPLDKKKMCKGDFFHKKESIFRVTVLQTLQYSAIFPNIPLDRTLLCYSSRTIWSMVQNKRFLRNMDILYQPLSPSHLSLPSTLPSSPLPSPFPSPSLPSFKTYIVVGSSLSTGRHWGGKEWLPLRTFCHQIYCQPRRNKFKITNKNVHGPK